MPLVTIKLVENVFTDEQKYEMIEKVTDVIVSIEGEAMRGITWVLIEETRGADWGIGGCAMSNTTDPKNSKLKTTTGELK
jgi:4-oxalocrotonate tautomerase